MSSLIWIVILPFVGSLCAAFLPSHARNAAAWLAETVAVVCIVLTFRLYWQIAEGEVVREAFQWAPALGLYLHVSHGWLCLAVRNAGDSDGRPGCPVCALLHGCAGSGTAFFLILAGFHGRHARRGAIRQPDSAGGVLGIDQPDVVHAHSILVSPLGRAPGRPHGIDCYGRRWSLPARRRPDAWGVAGSYDLDDVLASGDLIARHPWYLPVLILIAIWER